MIDSALDDLLIERKKVHGDYSTKAEFTYRIFDVLQTEERYRELTADKKLALLMIIIKIGRIIYGDSNHNDHWRDIAGYASLLIK